MSEGMSSFWVFPKLSPNIPTPYLKQLVVEARTLHPSQTSVVKLTLVLLVCVQSSSIPCTIGVKGPGCMGRPDDSQHHFWDLVHNAFSFYFQN